MVMVSDGEYTDSQLFGLIVTPVNDSPVLTEIGAQVTNEDTSLTIMLSAEDVDGDEIEILVGLSDSVNVSYQLDNT